MRGEQSKQAVKEILAHAHYATTASACERALSEDTPESYRDALHRIVNNAGPGEYAVNMDKAREALKNDR